MYSLNFGQLAKIHYIASQDFPTSPCATHNIPKSEHMITMLSMTNQSSFNKGVFEPQQKPLYTPIVYTVCVSDEIRIWIDVWAYFGTNIQRKFPKFDKMEWMK